MSVISVSCGSCGIGLSTSLFELIDQSIKGISNPDNGNNKDYASSMSDIYFKNGKDNRCVARSIMIGNDCKESQRLFSKNFPTASGGWDVNENMIIEYNQSANNCWAKGYYLAQEQGEVIRDYLSKEAEAADTLDSFLIFAGLAGGTGSGTSAFTSEIIKEEYPSTTQACVLALPFCTGENAMQSINTMLALTNMYESTNGVFLFENDRYDSICKNVYKDRSFQSINDAIANSLFLNIQPIAETCSISRKTLYRNHLERLMMEMCPYPKHKLLTCRGVPLNALKDENLAQSFELPTHNKLISQIIESINECVLPLEVPVVNEGDIDVHYTSFTPTNIEQGSILRKDNKGTTKKNFYSEEEEKYFYKNVSEVQIRAPEYLETCNSVLSKKGSDGKNLTSLNGKATKGKVRLINTGKIRKKPQKKNVVTSMNINIGGPVDEQIDIGQHLSQVVFWGHSASPAKACYSPWYQQKCGKSCGILTNCQTPLRALTRANDHIKMIYASNAYLYKYHEFGMDDGDFKEALMRGEQIVSTYNL